MLSAVIIDDEKIAIQILIEMLKISSIKVKIAGTALNLKDGVEIIKMTQPDIVFLDINMPEKNGFEIYNEFKCPEFKIIFCTAHQQYAFYALRKKACAYILKPIDLSELEKALQKVKDELDLEHKQLLLEDKISALCNPVMTGENIILALENGFIIENTRNIEYCYTSNLYSNVVMHSQKEYEIKKSLKDLEEILPAQQFYRTHKSFLVNIYYIKKFVHAKENYVIMESGTKIPVSVRISIVISKDIKKRILA